MNASQPPIILSSHDVQRLERLMETVGPEHRETVRALDAELARAEVRRPEEMPPNTVTMNAQVRCIDETTQTEHLLRLVYPADAGAAPGNVSVLAPVGAALLGLSAGQAIDWPLPGGRMGRLRVLGVIDQPEANGRLD